MRAALILTFSFSLLFSNLALAQDEAAEVGPVERTQLDAILLSRSRILLQGLAAAIHSINITDASVLRNRALPSSFAQPVLMGLRSDPLAVRELILTGDTVLMELIARYVLNEAPTNTESFVYYPQFLQQLIYSGDDRVYFALAEKTFAHPQWAAFPDLLGEFLARASYNARIHFLHFGMPDHWKNHPAFVAKLGAGNVNPGTIRSLYLPPEETEPALSCNVILSAK